MYAIDWRSILKYNKGTRTEVAVGIRSVVVRINVEEPIVVVVVVVATDPHGFEASVGVHVSADNRGLCVHSP